jgi:RimJ/RimL family protein N-acetyltransferase
MRVADDGISIRPTSVADLPDLMALWNDGRVMRWVGFPNGLGYDETSIARWFEDLQINPHRHHFVVTSSSVGFCGEVYYAVDAVHHRASLDIKFRPKAQGSGRATAAFLALIDRVFKEEPDVDSVWTEPVESNLASRTLYWQCGLRPTERPEGLRPGPSYWERRRDAW